MKFRYVISQEGVYRHGIGGVYTSFEVAKEQARQACIAEPDDYHQWAVLAVPFNMPYRAPTPETLLSQGRGLERVVGRWRRADARHRALSTGPVTGRTPGEPVWADEPVN